MLVKAFLFYHKLCITESEESKSLVYFCTGEYVSVVVVKILLLFYNLKDIQHINISR